MMTLPRLRRVVQRSLVETLRAVDDVLFPQCCLLSGTPLLTGTSRISGISDAAIDAHPPAPPPSELFALLARHFDADDIALGCVYARFAITIGSTIDAAIHALKYQGRTVLAQDLGKEVGRHVEWMDRDRAHSYAALIPVPIHAARRRERGYNQADHIAVGVAEILRAPVCTNTLVRTRYTVTQTQLDATHRAGNVHDAFCVMDRSIIHGRHILLIDDVLTTGSTLNACATALLEAGARRVDAATIAAAV